MSGCLGTGILRKFSCVFGISAVFIRVGVLGLRVSLLAFRVRLLVSESTLSYLGNILNFLWVTKMLMISRPWTSLGSMLTQDRAAAEARGHGNWTSRPAKRSDVPRRLDRSQANPFENCAESRASCDFVLSVDKD